MVAVSVVERFETWIISPIIEMSLDIGLVLFVGGKVSIKELDDMVRDEGFWMKCGKG